MASRHIRTLRGLAVALFLLGDWLARPRKQFTAEQVEQIEKLSAVLTQEQIADFMGISDSTIRRRLKDDPRVLTAYARGRARAIEGVAINLIQRARGGDMKAARFYLETQAGWKSTTSHEHTGKDGAPLTPQPISVTIRLVDPNTQLPAPSRIAAHVNGN